MNSLTLASQDDLTASQKRRLEAAIPAGYCLCIESDQHEIKLIRLNEGATSPMHGEEVFHCSRPERERIFDYYFNADATAEEVKLVRRLLRAGWRTNAATHVAPRS